MANNISATPFFASIEESGPEPHDRRAGQSEARLTGVAVGKRELRQDDPDRIGVAIKTFMGTLNRKELENLEGRDLQLTILASAFVLVQAAGLATFMYPTCSSTLLAANGRSASPFLDFAGSPCSLSATCSTAKAPCAN